MRPDHWVLILRQPLGEWARRANCKGVNSDLFFPTRGDMDSMREAKAVCAGCEVRAECLEHGIADLEMGVWGGTGDRERRRIRAARRRSGTLAARRYGSAS